MSSRCLREARVLAEQDFSLAEGSWVCGKKSISCCSSKTGLVILCESFGFGQSVKKVRPVIAIFFLLNFVRYRFSLFFFELNSWFSNSLIDQNRAAFLALVLSK